MKKETKWKGTSFGREVSPRTRHISSPVFLSSSLSRIYSAVRVWAPTALKARETPHHLASAAPLREVTAGGFCRFKDKVRALIPSLRSEERDWALANEGCRTPQR